MSEPTEYQLRRRALVERHLGRILTPSEAATIDAAGEFGKKIAAQLAPEDLDDLRLLLGGRGDTGDLASLALRRLIKFATKATPK